MIAIPVFLLGAALLVAVAVEPRFGGRHTAHFAAGLCAAAFFTAAAVAFGVVRV